METKIDGYPTEEFLNYIIQWNPFDFKVIDFIKLICENWEHGEIGYKIGRKYKGEINFELHTLGWSGNEDIIRALKDNTFFWIMNWYKSIRGGHYYFKIKV
jgi:hypothetical protein